MQDSQSMLQRLIHSLLEHNPPRAKSLCVTLLGDAIGPHGGSIWLSDLIELVTPLGINERLLRTSVFRLVAQNWLQSERHGRRSLYRLSEQGDELTRQASFRIYDGLPTQWDGDWTLVILPRFGNSSLSQRGAVRRELIWAGFGAIAPGIFALPRNQKTVAQKVLNKLKLSSHALVLCAHELNDGNGLLISSLISQCWDLEGVAAQYRKFSETFGPMLEASNQGIRPSQAFAVRALTIHEWRRIILHDPQLPVQMLPADWPGHAARELCGRLYWAVFDLAEEHLDQLLSQDPARYQAAKPYIYERFGGRNGPLGKKAAA
ncbi:phenylacetic acid degradation operon negative regulatory protein PaaX [Candidimonas sp. SYP-B2681]|uniref:phenylacetic acid degradation operon negative regulatory protein PaaX n=1 Tax=Candidimonas sp. SYP-B2681 TaxID=2497686 RepID=UPI000F87271A|nr:phenylacetic acid degradation operon negative regulatory protein PaaX [Candidimonas sp. SYP-B2681]RTZ41009.1 phenylacetic acid degradation operon negative regulatory protein PaaX [Candidimonas sp. SYP-B2681]